MIRRFMRDPDDVMEVYTAICERLQANDYKALVKFRTNSDLMPWLSVVAANACRDRLRKRRASSIPRSVLTRLDEFEQLVFKYYYWRRLPHEDIAEIINSNHGMSCSPLEVIDAIAKINDLLTVNKRWLLLVALNANQPTLSIDEMAETGYQPHDPDTLGHVDEALRNRDQLDRLSGAMSGLKREDQLLVLLRYEHGMTAPQIADVLHYDNHKHVYTRLRTVIGRLRRSLVD